MTSRTITSWVEIPVSDLAKSVAFYNEVFQYQMEIQKMEPNDIAVFGGQMDSGGGHLYPGTPAPDGGSTVHLALADGLEAAMARCAAAGGEVLSPPIEIPGAGRFAYAKDLDGNSIGMFEGT